MSDTANTRRLARQLVDVTRRLKHLETVPQLAHSSLDDHGMPVYDADGNLTVTVGKQPDGTWGAKPVAGPVPPRPVGLDAEGDAGAIRASWQGVFWAGAALPMDFEAVQVLVNGSVYAAIHDPEGGSVQVPALPGERLVSFRTLSQAGVASEAVAFGTVTVEPRVSEQMQELGENLSELRDVTLPELADELDDAASDLQSKLDAANARIDDIIVDGGGAGNFTTYSINEPSGEGTGEGDQWFRVVNGEVLGQWRWDGAAWQAVTLTDAVIAGIDLSKLVGNGGLSEVVANRMFTDIFTANKITSQEIAAGSITTEKIAAEGIVADVIQGGSFVGESFEGGTFTGGLFKTSDALPGQVTLSDDALSTSINTATGPGIRITPEDASGFEYMPGIGPSTAGLMIYGGKRVGAGASIVQANPTESFMRTFREDGTRAGEVQTSASSSYMRTYRADGVSTGGEIQASGNDTFMQTYSEDGRRGNIYTDGTSASVRTVGTNGLNTARLTASGNSVTLFSATNGQRYLELNDTGIWIRTGPSGNQKSYNLEETAQDSGWNSFPVRSGITAGQGLAWRNKNGVIYFRGTVLAAWSAGWNTVVTGLPTEMRPSSTIVAPSPNGSETGLLMQMTPSGDFLVFKPTAGGRTMFVSSMIYVTG